MKTPLKKASYLHKPHLRFVQDLWTSNEDKIKSVIDATLGNGHDSLFLLENVLKEGSFLIGLDIQQQAIESASKLIEENLSSSKVLEWEFLKLCHSRIDTLSFKSPPDLIIYNLGYLPTGNKQLTTLKETTLESIKKGLKILAHHGMMTITLYPGHEEGKNEALYIENFVETLDVHQFQVLKFQWLKQPTAPYVIVIQKRK